MSRPRLLLLTHQQVSRPGIFSVLISRCTSPDKSQTADRIATRLHKEWKASKSIHALCKRAAEEAVLMAEGYEFLTQAGFWDWKGRVIAELSRRPHDAQPHEFLHLGDAERLIHLKYYLEAQGALAIPFAHLLLEKGSISEAELKRESLFEQWLVEAYRWALSNTSDLRERVAIRQRIREIELRKFNRYDPDVRWHKLRPIAQPLVDFGFAVVTGREPVFGLFRDARGCPLAILLQEISSIDKLEHLITTENLLVCVAKALGLVPNATKAEDKMWKILAEAYRSVRQLPTGIASITAIADICGVRALTDYNRWLPPCQVLQLLEQLQKRGGARFYFDRSGKKANVTLAESALSEIENVPRVTKDSAIISS